MVLHLNWFTKLLCVVRNHLTLTYAVRLLWTCEYLEKGPVRCIMNALYAFYQFLLGTYLAIACIMVQHIVTYDPSDAECIDFDKFLHYVAIEMIGRQILFVAGIVSGVLWTRTVVSFTFFRFVGPMGVYYRDMYNFTEFVLRLKFTLFERIHYSSKKKQKFMYALAKDFRFEFEPRFDFRARLYFVRLFWVNDIIFFVISIILICTATGISLVMLYYMYVIGYVTLTAHFFMVALIGICFAFNCFYFGMICSSMLAQTLHLFLTMVQYSWNHYCKRVLDRPVLDLRHVNRKRILCVLGRFQLGRKLFLETLLSLRMVSARMINQIFTSAFFYCLLSNAIFMLQSFDSKNRLTLRLGIWIFVLLESLISFLVIYDMLRTSDRMYCLNGAFMGNYVKLSRFLFRKRCSSVCRRLMLSWNLFLELCCTKTKFRFRIGSLGSISRKSVFFFGPTYSVLIILILKYQRKEQHGNVDFKTLIGL